MHGIQLYTRFIDPLFLPFLETRALTLTLLGVLSRICITLALLPPDITIVSHLRIIKALLVLVAKLDIALLGIGTVQLNRTQLARNLLVLLGLEPRPLRPRHDLITVLHEVLTLGELHLSLRELLLGLFLLQDFGNLVGHILGLLRPAVGNGLLDHTTDDLGALRLTGADGKLDDLAVRLGGNRACTTRAAGTGCTSNTMQVDLVALGSLVVNDRFDTLDIQTTRRNVSGEKVGNLAISEVFDGFDTLYTKLVVVDIGQDLFRTYLFLAQTTV